ncbi:hypothetical protein B9Z55_018287 [Caenorhabditis nigoni]|uniref:Uncharacterized protein n=1 Tax=Caenorhabditis nigoni TaxID=1611254 RepID=A0A2G5TDH7_9PELO|nr:hypothetical protein B9Z55_018287 [Caenorhabditis nigoni]
MDTEKDEDWEKEYYELMRIALLKWTKDCKDCQACRRKQSEDEEAERRAERRAKRREERKKIKENIRKQKKVWKLAQDRARAAKDKDRRYRKKMRASHRKKVQWRKKRYWLPMRIFHLLFWIRPMNMLIANVSQICDWSRLSNEIHVSKYRSKKKRKKRLLVNVCQMRRSPP